MDTHPLISKQSNEPNYTLYFDYSISNFMYLLKSFSIDGNTGSKGSEGHGHTHPLHVGASNLMKHQSGVPGKIIKL